MKKGAIVILVMAFLIGLEPAGKAFCFQADVQDISGERYFPAVMEALAEAAQSIQVVMYIVELPAGQSNGKPQQLIDALIHAHKRGVDVEVVLDRSIGESNKGRGQLQTQIKSMQAYKQLREAGVKVYYDEPSRYTHAKAIVIDGKTVILGSANWSASALNRNIEVNVLVKSQPLAQRIREYLGTIHRSPSTSLGINFATGAQIGQTQPAVPIELAFMKSAKYAPHMVNKNDERAFDIYLFLRKEYDGNPQNRITLVYDTVAKFLGMDTSNRTAYRRQIIKVLRKLEKRYGLIRFEPQYAKEATITLLDLEDPGKTYFDLPEAYFDYGWNRELSFGAKICYMINLINASASETKPVWSKSVAQITGEFGHIGTNVIHAGMDELRRKQLIEVAYDDLTGKAYTERKPKTYKVLDLYDFGQLQDRLKKLEDQYGKKEYAQAHKYAEIVFQEYNPSAMEDIMLKSREYGQEKVEKAFAIVAQKNKDNPKRKYSYVVGILENWGK